MAGRTLSTVLMSCENLFSTRPIGVVSKNCMGQRRTARSNSKCIFAAAPRQPFAWLIDVMNMVTPTDQIHIACNPVNALYSCICVQAKISTEEGKLKIIQIKMACYNVFKTIRKELTLSYTQSSVNPQIHISFCRVGRPINHNFLIIRPNT